MKLNKHTTLFFQPNRPACVVPSLQPTRVGLSTEMTPELCTVINKLHNSGLSAVHLAVLGGHIHIASYLLKLGADVNQRDGKAGYTHVHYAISKYRDSNQPLIQYLVEQVQTDLNTKDYANRTPLMLAEGYRCLETLRYLVRCGPGREWLFCPPYISEDSDE